MMLLEKSKDYELGFEHGISFAKEKLRQEIEYIKGDSRKIIIYNMIDDDTYHKQEFDTFYLHPNGEIRVLHLPKDCKSICVRMDIS